MATGTLDSHQTSTSDEQTANLSSEAVKAVDHINIPSQKVNVEDNSEKVKGDIILSTLEEKAEDIHVKKPDETPVVDILVSDNLKVEAALVPSATIENRQMEPPSTESVIVAVEKSIEERPKIVDATDNVKIGPDEQSSAEIITRESLEVSQVELSGETVNERPAVQSVVEVPEKPEPVHVPVEKQEEKKIEVIDNPEFLVDPIEKSGKCPTDEQQAIEKEQNGQPETNSATESSVEPSEEEKQPIDVLPVKEPVQMIEKQIIETVEPPKEKEQASEIHPVEVKEKISESVELPEENESLVEVHPVKELKVTIEETSESIGPPKNKEQTDEVVPVTGCGESEGKEASGSASGSKEIENKEPVTLLVSEEQLETSCVPQLSVESPEKEKQPIEIIEKVEQPHEKEKASEIHTVQESSEVIVKEIGESVELPKENELVVEVHSVKELEVTAKETIESIEPLKNEEHPDEVLSGEVMGKEIGESVELPKENELLAKVHSVKELEVTAKETIEPIELLKKKEQPDEVLSGEVMAKEIGESVELPKETELLVEVPSVKELEVTAKETIESIELLKNKEQPDEVLSGEVMAKEIGESVELPKENELLVEVHPVKELEVTTIETIKSIELLKNKKQPDEVLSGEVMAKEIGESVELPKENELLVEVHPVKELEVTAKETIESIELLKNKEQPDDVIHEKESGDAKGKETSDSTLGSKEVEKQEPATATESVNVEKEQPETSSIPELCVEPPEKVKQPIEIVPVKDPIDIIEKKIIETVEPPQEKEQVSEVHLGQESTLETANKVNEFVELPEENELADEVHPVKELIVKAKETSESNEHPENKEQLDEILSIKESEVKAKDISESSDPLKSEGQSDEVFSVTEHGEVNGRETSGSTLASKEVEKQEPEVIKEKDGQGDYPEITNQVQNNNVEGETEKEEGSSVPRIDIDPPLGGGQVQEEDQSAVKSDKQHSVGEVTQSDPTADSVNGPEKEQPATEFVSVDKEPNEQKETTSVPELCVESPKKEEQPIEVLKVKESVEVIAKEISEPIDLPGEKEQVAEVHLVQESREVIAADYAAPELSAEVGDKLELPKEKEQGTEAHLMQGSKEVVAETISPSVELPNENELLIEGHPEKESKEAKEQETEKSVEALKKEEQPVEVLSGKESEVIVKDVAASSVPAENKDQPDEVFSKSESKEVKEKETSGPILSCKEVEKPESEVMKVEDGQRELPEITSKDQNNYVEVGQESIVKCETEKDEKSLALGDDITLPLGGEQIHKEEKQCTEESNKQDSLGQVVQPDVKLAVGDIPPQYMEEKATELNENKESSNTDLDKKLSEAEEIGVGKLGEENENKILQSDKGIDKSERIQESTLFTEEEVGKGLGISSEVAEKSIDDKKTDEVVIAETKIEERVKDEIPALVDTGNAQHGDGKLDINETPQDFQESVVEVKDKETMIAGTEIPTTIQDKELSKKEDDEIKLSENLQKEVPSKPAQKQSHNILSKVKQSLVKAKKAIIGKSHGSKTLSSEAKDDIKVK